MRRFILAAATALAAATPAVAQQAFVGVFAHDVEFIGETLGTGAAGKEDGADLHFGVRTGELEALRAVGRPRLYAFASLNSEDQSNFAGVGLGYTFELGRRFYLQPGLGLVYTDGADELPDFREPGISVAEARRRAALRDTNIEFGSKVLFEPEIALGYRFTERVAFELAYTHISNGGILSSGDTDQNDGLDDVGVRLVYSFGGA